MKTNYHLLNVIDELTQTLKDTISELDSLKNENKSLIQQSIELNNKIASLNREIEIFLNPSKVVDNKGKLLKSPLDCV